MRKPTPRMRENMLATRLMVTFRRAERAVAAKEGAVVRAHGLTPMQFGVLDVLWAKGPLRIGQLIDAMLSTSGNMTVVIRNMERDGYVRRETDPADRRSFLIALTDKGERKIQEVLPEHAEHLTSMYSVLSEQEQRELIRLLRKLKAV